MYRDTLDDDQNIMTNAQGASAAGGHSLCHRCAVHCQNTIPTFSDKKSAMSSTSKSGAEVVASAGILATAAATLTVVVKGGAPFEWRQRGRIEGFSKMGEEEKKTFRYETKVLKVSFWWHTTVLPE